MGGAGGSATCPAFPRRTIMLEFYTQIHAVHVWAISLSGLWMTIRGLGLIGGRHWPRSSWAWAVGLAIDGTVLTAAAMLFTILPSVMFADDWLSVKLLFVAIYFAAGYWLLLAEHTRIRQVALLAASMAGYALAYGVARAHDPAGWLAILGM